ncbi:uncharacterized protein LOC129617415 [Condylostylus longicornis]|uniref:uncharacterized protein LOC129617415 n=1 Tax=Condylostylus longicornis TaxID=2530218 RepID=UPI00244E0781|nr:uncharacterized protein LOC129617415 [Condylostylus longicornis]
MEQLMEIGVAASIMDEALRNAKSMAALDSYYLGLNCELLPVDRKSNAFKSISLALKNTHARTHNSYSLRLVDIYECKRAQETERYLEFLNSTPLENRKLLWHGSRLTNWAGILKTGLRIAPPEAPVTGYMFGKGIYFADMVSKSSNYCFADQKNPYGILVLSEVALGDPYHKLNAEESAAKNCKEKGCHHTWGIGGTLPDPSSQALLPSRFGGSLIPLHTGKGVSSKSVLEQIKMSGSSSLLYNEYIVYDEAQVTMRYILRVEFNYKSFMEDDPSSSSSSDSDDD